LRGNFAHTANALYTKPRELVQSPIQVNSPEELAPRGVIVRKRACCATCSCPPCLKGSIRGQAAKPEQDAFAHEASSLQKEAGTERKRIEAQGIADFFQEDWWRKASAQQLLE